MIDNGLKFSISSCHSMSIQPQSTLATYNFYEHPLRVDPRGDNLGPSATKSIHTNTNYTKDITKENSTLYSYVDSLVFSSQNYFWYFSKSTRRLTSNVIILSGRSPTIIYISSKKYKGAQQWMISLRHKSYSHRIRHSGLFSLRGSSNDTRSTK